MFVQAWKNIEPRELGFYTLTLSQWNNSRFSNKSRSYSNNSSKLLPLTSNMSTWE